MGSLVILSKQRPFMIVSGNSAERPLYDINNGVDNAPKTYCGAGLKHEVTYEIKLEGRNKNA